MSKHWFFFDTATGDGAGSSTCESLPDFPSDWSAIETPVRVAWDISYIENGVISEKQDYTLDALPTPCVAVIEGVEYQITAQPTFEFEPGAVAVDYVISIDAGVQYFKKEFTIHVDKA